MWARYKADGTDLNEIPSLADQRAFVQNLDTVRLADVPKGIDGKEYNWDFEGIVTAEEVATSSIREKLREVQRVCEDEASLRLRKLLTSLS